jgi:hypothetical protein
MMSERRGEEYGYFLAKEKTTVLACSRRSHLTASPYTADERSP